MEFVLKVEITRFTKLQPPPFLPIGNQSGEGKNYVIMIIFTCIVAFNSRNARLQGIA